MIKKPKLYVTKLSEKFYEDCNKDFELKRPLKIEEVEKGIILPAKEIVKEHDFIYKGGVLNSNKEFIKLSAVNRNIENKSLQEGYELTEEPSYCDETVIYGGILYEFYGHVLLESLNRLWYYLKPTPPQQLSCCF